ncbi:MFS transporter, DHA1 family, tetracycline resistance protein [Pseudarcicella hirudinis]|uniref:MFS transporter, DHA1 family, tetracycline resistance protein n=1 Tax=Pseudarcicella hirudinis TaxID=1079859 RepID=A0A1I5PCX3_9BACT|nr:TCR/Tet family MFS transporter [Pseudarcicella hirudinis]SFP31895.1 MFS transporter, DHA1 family, tetracycline resistance protein [Pseudarcicella hirudinis]
MSEKRSPAIFFIFITMLIDVLGIGLIIPILPTLIQSFTGGDLSNASRYSGWLMASYAIMQFIFSPVLGGLSDKYGRRPIILASLFGFAVDYTILGFAPNIFWLFAGRMLAGITGASFTTASAYIADVSKPEDRAKNFGMIGAAFGLGFVIGPAIGGLLAHFGLRVPFFAAAGLTLVNWLYGYFILPESLKKENRREFDWKRANPVGSLMNLTKYPVILGLIGSFLCIQIAGQAHPSTWSYFTMKEFGWSPAEVGYSLAFVGLMVALIQGGLTRVITPKIGERKAVIVGLIFYGFGFLLFAFASHGWMMYAFMVPFALGGIAGPSLQSVITQQVGPSEQGELQGGLTSLQSVTTIIGPLLASNLFAYFTSKSAPFQFAGAAFFSAGLLVIIGLLIAIRFFPKGKPKAETVEV